MADADKKKLKREAERAHHLQAMTRTIRQSVDLSELLDMLEQMASDPKASKRDRQEAQRLLAMYRPRSR